MQPYTVSEAAYLPDTYLSVGGRNVRNHFRTVEEVLQEKPMPGNPKARRVKQTKTTRTQSSTKRLFVRHWSQISVNKTDTNAEIEFDTLNAFLPNINSLNMLILALASKYRTLLPIASSTAWNIGDPQFESLNDAVRNLTPQIYKDASSLLKTSAKAFKREGVVRDVLRYIRMIMMFEELQQQNEREYQSQLAHVYEDEEPSE